MSEALDINSIPRTERGDSDRVLSPEEQRDLTVAEYVDHWVKQAPVPMQEKQGPQQTELPHLRLITNEDYEKSLDSIEFVDPPKPKPRSLRVIKARTIERLQQPEKVLHLIDFLAANGAYAETKKKH